MVFANVNHNGLEMIVHNKLIYVQQKLVQQILIVINQQDYAFVQKDGLEQIVIKKQINVQQLIVLGMENVTQKQENVYVKQDGKVLIVEQLFAQLTQQELV